MESVALPGPPLVIFIISSNSCRVPIVEVIDVKRIIGLSSGTVIAKNCLGPEAPSIFAAS
ncbi:hypothetical protein D3C76_1824540 [compost metagenome]